MKKILDAIKKSDVIMGESKIKKVRVAINGFGRIGRAFLKVALASEKLEVVAINDLGDINNMAYLLQKDTVYKSSNFEVVIESIKENEQYIIIKNIYINDKSKNIKGSRTEVKTSYKKIKDKKIKFISQRDPLLLPWKENDIDIVIESTGLFVTYDKAKVHIDSGAKHVIISAPAKIGEDKSIVGETVLMSVNEEKLKVVNITSNASCTTNASSPLIAILDKALGIEKAMLNTVHAYTASQSKIGRAHV